MLKIRKSWTKFLTEKSSWGKKPDFKQRLAMYSAVIAKFRQYGFENFGVCKETLEMHKALGMKHADIKCNCITCKR